MNAKNNFDIEKTQLIEKIEKSNQILEQLIENNFKINLLSNEQLSKLEEIKQKNQKFQYKLKSNEFEIAIVGLEKAGKSTFANALIKSNILPSAPERCTFTSTRLISGKDQASVQFYTESEFEHIFQELLNEIEYKNENQKFNNLTQEERNSLEKMKVKYKNIENGNIHISSESKKQEQLKQLKQDIANLEAKNTINPENSNNSSSEQTSFRNLSLSDFENYFSNLEESNPTLFKNHVGKTDEEIKDILICRDRLTLTGEKKIFKGEELKRNSFQAYIRGEQQGKDTSKPRSVCRIEIESSELKQLENAIIYDVPGFDSPTKIHIRQTEERLKSADAIILVTNVGTNPSLQGTTLSVITKNTDEDGIALKDKLFIFGNQLDRVNHEKDLQGNTNILINDVEKYKIGERKRVFTGSAYKYLSDEKIIPETKLNHNVSSNMNEIRDALIQYYQTERLEILKRKIDTNQKLMISVLEKVLNDSNFDENFSQESEQAKITKKSYKLVENTLEWELQKLRDELKKEISEQKYFTNKFRHSIYSEAYFLEITEEDFERQRILNDNSIRTELAINRINQKIRENLHKDFLSQFTNLIKAMTDDKAKEIEIRLLRTFTTAICQDNPNTYDEIEILCQKFIHKVTNDVAHSENSFTYLLERFSRDIFDILLSSAVKSQDRINRYKQSIREYTYLDSYYSSGAGHLINLLLIQKHQNLFNLDSVGSLANVVQQVITLASNINGTTASLKTLNTIKLLLENTTTTFSIKDSIGIQAILEEAKESQTQEEVLQEVNTDINNLKLVLEKAVLPASNLELAFLNGVDKQIQSLIVSFKSSKNNYSETWDDFISKIVPIVKKSDFEKINNSIEMHQLKKQLIEQIAVIIKNVEPI